MSESDINRELELPPIHKEIGAETHGRILGTVVSVNQYSNTALLVGLVFERQHPQHINEGGVESLALTIHLGVVLAGSEFLYPH